MEANGPIDVLLVEDDPVYKTRIVGVIDAAGAGQYRMTHVTCVEAALERLRQRNFDVVLLDLFLPDSEGLETLDRIHRQAAEVPIVVLSGMDDEQTALAALSQGAQDYLMKGKSDDGPLVVRAIRYAIQRQRAEAQVRQLNADLERRVAERTADLEAANRQLQRGIEERARVERLASLGTLAAGIAHEINNPVAAVLYSAEAALNVHDDPDLVRECLENVVKSAQRCRSVVEHVLSFAKPSASEKRPHDVNEIVRHSFEFTRSYLERHGAEWELNLPDDLPQVTLNPVELEQVLLNLVRNAVEATEGKVRITLRSEATGDGVRLTVADNGCGMSEEEQRRAFDPFYSTRHDRGGTGLGLSIARGIIEGHGGTIGIEARPGRGTTITIDLPAAQETD